MVGYVPFLVMIVDDSPYTNTDILHQTHLLIFHTAVICHQLSMVEL